MQTPGREENFLGSSQAAALFNVAFDYHSLYPNDANLIFTGGSTAEGLSALNANGRPIHSGHLGGLNIDLRYMGKNGRSIFGEDAFRSADVGRMLTIIQLFGAANSGLGAAFTGNQARFGLGPISAELQFGHRNHIHFQAAYPQREELRNRPGQR